jgi:hypothetical protein
MAGARALEKCNEKQQILQHIERNFERAPDFLAAKQ